MSDDDHALRRREKRAKVAAPEPEKPPAPPTLVPVISDDELGVFKKIEAWKKDKKRTWGDVAKMCSVDPSALSKVRRRKNTQSPRRTMDAVRAWAAGQGIFADRGSALLSPTSAPNSKAAVSAHAALYNYPEGWIHSQFTAFTAAAQDCNVYLLCLAGELAFGGSLALDSYGRLGKLAAYQFTSFILGVLGSGIYGRFRRIYIGVTVVKSGTL